MDKYRNKNILIVGFGKSGIAALRALSGVAARVSVYDAKELNGENLETFAESRKVCEVISYFGGKLPPKNERFDFVILSPGVPPGIEVVANAINNGAELTGDLELAYDFASPNFGRSGGFVAITGTNGKTTTTALTGEIWRRAGRASAVTGNIGTPVSETALEAAPGCEFITEVSSFQLETIHEGGFRPYIAAYLNLTPDHLDRYETMENYGAAKARVFINQKAGDFLVLNADDDGVMKIAARAYASGLAVALVLFSRRAKLVDGNIYLPGSEEPVNEGAFSINGKIYLTSAPVILRDPQGQDVTAHTSTPSSCGREADRRTPAKGVTAHTSTPSSCGREADRRTPMKEVTARTHKMATSLRYLMDVSDLQIPGNHNLENALAAAAMAVCAGIDDEIIAEALREFGGVEHRMELIDTIGGVRYVNDSKGTNTDASRKAIDAVSGGIILIAGGYDKHADFTDFIRAFGGKVRHLILLGETAGRFAETAEKAGYRDYTIVKNMAEAVNLGAKIAKPGETVLLSPASASWDMYKCFEERGDHFRGLVAELRENINA
jgi:UDP-N-acetylmuramoylalanine-D-glutamate ligase